MSLSKATGAQPSRYASLVSGPHAVEVAESWRLERVTAPETDVVELIDELGPRRRT